MRLPTIFGVLAPVGTSGAACDQACLKAKLDQYLNVVVQRNPGAVPRPGTGLWQSARALGKLQRRYFGPPFDGSRPVAPPPK